MVVESGQTSSNRNYVGKNSGDFQFRLFALLIALILAFCLIGLQMVLMATKPNNEEIKTRFKWAGIKSGKTTRIFANKSIVNPSLTRSDSLANSKHTERLEDAIRLNHLIEIEFFSSSAKFSNSKKEKFVEVWPIQLIFHNIGWYLACLLYTSDAADE